MHAQLVLIGTVHHDLRGYEKLSALLSVLKPDIITLELSPYGRGFRTKQQQRLSQKLLALYAKTCGINPDHDNSAERWPLPSSVQSLLCTLNYPFEFLAARDYTYAHKVPLYCIDLSSVSRQKTRTLKREALSISNLKALLTLPDKNFQESVDLCYKKAQRTWDAGTFITKAAIVPPAIDNEREQHMSRRIKNLRRRHPDKKLVHIGGWEHLIAHAACTTMYEQLRYLKPERILLTDERSCATSSFHNR